MFETVRPFAEDNILEIGSGIGNISEFFLQHQFNTTLSDYEDFYIKELKEKFSSYPNLQEVLKIDLQHAGFINVYGFLKEKFKTVFLLNVLEHLADDDEAIANAKFLLQPGGTLIILTPAYNFLFSSLDKELGHYRRYNSKKLETIFAKNNLKIKKSFYFNALGIPAWLYGKLFRLKTIPSGEMRFYNKLTPFAKLIDKILMNKLGLSVIIAGVKPK
jgi:2-polyprenyl-3-methyl-5-hydroxy-6-metoxy-1,4-benzoquinol methylase